MKMRLVAGALGALALFLGAGSRARAEFYTITDLGTFSGNTFFRPVGLNDSGQVVGTSYGASTGYHAFLYSGGKMVDLGLPAGSVPYGINSSGQIVGTINYDPTSQAFLYSGGKFTVLGTFGGQSSYGYGINDSGQVVGGAQLKYTPSQSFLITHPFVYSNGTMTGLGPPNYYGYGVAINSSGQIVGSNGTGIGSFLYSNGKMTALPLDQATAINNLGQVVGSVNRLPFISSNGKAYNLGTLPGYTFGTATGINDGGRVIGNLRQTVYATSPSQPFLWKGGPLIPLQSLLPPDSNWKLIEATAMNNRGQVAGWGYNPQGDARAFLITPPAEAPEPSSLVLLGMGAASLAGYAWRKRKHLTHRAPCTAAAPAPGRAP
jgi:probable HAF family extracellular repeat protein